MRKWVKKHKKRFIAFILSLVFGVGSAFALSCPAFAESDITWYQGLTCTYTYDTWRWQASMPFVETSNYGINQNHVYEVENQCYRDMDFYITERFNLSPTMNNDPNYVYNGYLQSFGTLSFRATPNNTYSVIDSLQVIEADSSIDCDYNIHYNTSTRTQTGNMEILTFKRNEIFYFENAIINTNDYFWNTSHYKVRCWYHSNSSSYEPGITFSFNLDTTPTGNSILARFHSDLWYLFNSLETSKQILTSINNGNSSVVSAINSASNQAHSDSQTINNQLQGDDQILSDISDGKSLTDSRIGAVDNIIASVAPDADTSIQNVSTVISNNGTFWSSQRNASLFWKEIISDMYDSTITGFLGVGLSIVLIIILFIFILRL